MFIHSQWQRAFFAAALASAAALFCFSSRNALAQAGTTPKGDTGAPGAATQTPPAAGSPTSMTDWLIGQAVSGADSPQFKGVTDAITRFKNGDLNGARELLTAAYKDNSKLPPVEVMIARMLAASNQVGPARAELERAVKAYPDDPEAYLLFAESALADRRATDAEALLLEAKPLIANFSSNLKRKRNFDIRLNAGLATVAEARGKWNDAADFVKAWMKLDTENAQAHSHMGTALFQQGNYAEAKKEFDEAVKLDPKTTASYIAMARLYEQAGKHDDAKTAIGYAIQTNKNDLNVHLAAAQWALVTNQLNDAKKYADAALVLSHDSLDAKILSGTIARISGDLNGAKKILSEAVGQSPANIDASNQLALSLVESNVAADQQKGLEYATRNAEVTTKGNQFNPEVLATLAWALYKNGNKQDAAKVLNQVISVGQISPDTAFYLAKILEDGGEKDKAINILETAIKSQTPFAQRDAAATLLAKLKKDKEADDKGGKSSDAKGSDTKGGDAKGSDKK